MAKYTLGSKDIEGRKLDHLAAGKAKVIDGEIVTDKGILTKLFGAYPIPKKDRDRELRSGGGFWVRLNPRKGRPHTYNVDRKNGTQKVIGDVLIALDKGVGNKKATKCLHDAEAEAKAIREGREVEAGKIETLEQCYDFWKGARSLSTSSDARVKSSGTLKECARAMALCPKWHDRRIGDIESSEIILKAQKIETTAVNGGSRRGVVRSFLKSLSAIHTATAEFHETTNRFALMKRKHYPKPKSQKKKPRKHAHRVLTHEEIAAILNLTRDDFRKTTVGKWVKGKGYANTKENALNITQWRKMLAMKFALLTGFRIGGVCGLKVSDINGVSIDREEMDKTGNEHRFPISTQLRAILDEALALKAGTDPDSPDDWMLTSAGIIASDYLFCFAADGSRFDGNGSSSSRLWIDARNLLGDRMVGGLPKIKGKKQTEPRVMQAHDCRVTLRVFARRCGLSLDQAKDLLGHSRDTGDITDDYDDYEDEELVTEFDHLATDLQKIHDAMFKVAKEHSK